ncbi:DJ-1/YajL/PfpI superfamily protein [Chitinispirillum alkaliphilum]|nr:DJ-1/YajL/PfpI superfamily protein [Chitinispirillum alkaliphilum]
MPRAIIVLADGFEELEAVACIDLLRRSPVEVCIAGLDSLTITGSHEIRLEADMLLENHTPGFDALILPGGMPGTKNLAHSTPLKEVIIKADHEKKLLAAICAAPTVLYSAGVLKNKKATCYPGFEKQFSETIFVEKPVVRDEHIITSRGAGTAIPFSLEIIKYICGSEHSEKIASSILYEQS